MLYRRFLHNVVFELNPPMTEIMQSIISFHGYLWIFLLFIATFVFYVLGHIIICMLWFNRYLAFVLLSYAFLEATLNKINISTNFLHGLKQQTTTMYDRYPVITHSPKLELIWTLSPSIILFLIAIPSFSLLYSVDEPIDPLISTKVIGYQWYWSYEYPALKDVNNVSITQGKKLTTQYFLEETKTHPLYSFRDVFRELDFVYSNILSKRNPNRPLYNIKTIMSYMEPASTTLDNNQFRLLEVDNSFVLPVGTHVRLLITAYDVLHSWAVPSFGIKLDAVPGRLNSINVKVKREGIAYGQCSELCGANHGFMPIAVRVVSVKEYISVLKTALSKNS